MRWIIVAAAVSLAGCTLGMREDGSNAATMSFRVPVGFQEAYRRADAYARHCHGVQSPLKDAMSVTGNLFSDNKTGIVRIEPAGGGNDLERFEIAEVQGESSVTVSRWKIGIWDEREDAAARASIASGKPVCRS